MRQTAIDEWLHAYGDIGTCFRYSWLMSVSAINHSARLFVYC